MFLHGLVDDTDEHLQVRHAALKLQVAFAFLQFLLIVSPLFRAAYCSGKLVGIFHLGFLAQALELLLEALNGLALFLDLSSQLLTFVEFP